MTDRADVTDVAERIQQVLHAPFNLDGHVVVTTASIGIAFGLSKDLPEDLLRQADAAMYQIKKEGRNGVRFFGEGMDPAPSTR